VRAHPSGGHFLALLVFPILSNSPAGELRYAEKRSWGVFLPIFVFLPAKVRRLADFRQVNLRRLRTIKKYHDQLIL
jgi:hypothetical protein